MNEMTKRNVFKTYQTKSTEVQAIPFTVENLPVFKHLFPTLMCLDGYRLDGKLFGYDDEYHLILEEGDYLIVDEDGEFYVLNPELFEESYHVEQPTFTTEEQELIMIALHRLAMEKRTDGWRADAQHQRCIASKCFKMANQLIELANKIEQMTEGVR